MTTEEANLILEFLGRADIKFREAPAAMDCIRVIEQTVRDSVAPPAEPETAEDKAEPESESG